MYKRDLRDSEVTLYELFEWLKEEPRRCNLSQFKDKTDEELLELARVAKPLIEIHPKYKDFCENMNNRMFDLMKIFRDGLYTDPKFKGSYSIKKVLPILVPDLSYEGMEIGEGATAMASWASAFGKPTVDKEMVHKLDENELDKKDKIREDLLGYCELDTLAMVRIWEKLKVYQKP